MKSLFTVLRSWIPQRGSTGRRAGLVVFGDGITFVALFATSMVLARIVLPADMGTYRQITYLGPLVIQIVEIGLGGTVYRFFPAFAGEERRSYLLTVLSGMSLFGFGGSLFLFLAAAPLAAVFNNPELGPALRICAVYPLASMPFMLVRPLLINQGHSLKATLWETSFAVGTNLALIISLQARWPLPQSFALWIGANLLRLPVAFWYLCRAIGRPRPPIRRHIVKTIWDYMWPLQLSRLPGIGIASLDKVVTSVWLTRESFAAYSLGARELPFINQIPFSISSVTIPRMVTHFQDNRLGEVCRLWRRACLTTAALTYPLAAFAVWQAHPITRVLFTATYADSAIPFGCFAALTFLRVTDYGSLAKALGNSRLIFRASLFGSCLSLPIIGFATWAFGVWGVCASSIICNALIVGYYLVKYRRILHCATHRFYPWPDLLLLLGSAFFAAIASDYCSTWLFGALLPKNTSGTLGLLLIKGLMTLGLYTLSARFCTIRRQVNHSSNCDSVGPPQSTIDIPPANEASLP